LVTCKAYMTFLLKNVEIKRHADFSKEIKEEEFGN
jgi:hypothetical protein